MAILDAHLKKAKNIAKNILYRINRNPYSRRRYETEIAKRARLPLTDIQSLAKQINLFSPYTYEINPPNDFYGQASTLKKFLDLPETYQFKFVIEHGIYLEKAVSELDTDTLFSSITTCTKERIPILSKYKSHVFPIGPIFHYASSLLSEEEVKQEKKRLGKNLLVFPSHSIPGINSHFNVQDLCQEIKKHAVNFKSVSICLYWRDIQLGFDEVYKKNGFECVTAGHVLDPNFLSRLKSIIRLSDFTLSNDPGSYVGYCIMLGKRHLIIQQDLSFTGYSKGVSIVDNLHKDAIFQEIFETFSKENQKGINKKQLDLINKHWGANQVKTKQELKQILEKTEKIYQSEQFELLKEI